MGDPAADGMRSLQAVYSRTEPVLAAALRDLTALSQVELTVAGRLESSIDQVLWPSDPFVGITPSRFGHEPLKRPVPSPSRSLAPSLFLSA